MTLPLTTPATDKVANGSQTQARDRVGGLGVPGGRPPVKMDGEEIEKEDPASNRPIRDQHTHTTPEVVLNTRSRHPRRPAAPAGTTNRDVNDVNNIIRSTSQGKQKDPKLLVYECRLPQKQTNGT